MFGYCCNALNVGKTTSYELKPTFDTNSTKICRFLFHLAADSIAQACLGVKLDCRGEQFNLNQPNFEITLRCYREFNAISPSVIQDVTM